MKEQEAAPWVIDEAFRGGGVVRRQIGVWYPPRGSKGDAGRWRRIIARSAFVDLSRRSSHTQACTWSRRTMATRLESRYGRDYAGYITAGRCGVHVLCFIPIGRCKYGRKICASVKERSEAGKKRIEINASGLMKGREDHQLLIGMELLDRVDKKATYPGIVRPHFISAA